MCVIAGGQRSGLQPKCYVWHAAEAPAAVAPALSVSSLRNAALTMKGTCNGKNRANFMSSIGSQRSLGYRGIAVNAVTCLIKMILRESDGVILSFFGVFFFVFFYIKLQQLLSGERHSCE